MEMSDATAAMSALSQPTRYRCFQLLIQRGQASAGELAEALGTPANLLSSHLSILSAARLITSVREGRSIIYAPDKARLAELISHLVSMASA
ncbi:metalloregulator ArsR/SmtB family transcription factor [uncultured Sphingobium sp.]|uniref:ArsR/SmtB family transcription factor n=1 Tax=uncultured Sphingobium sp. TaxID=316087 RepID=UPI0032B14D15